MIGSFFLKDDFFFSSSPPPLLDFRASYVMPSPPLSKNGSSHQSDPTVFLKNSYLTLSPFFFSGIFGGQVLFDAGSIMLGTVFLALYKALPFCLLSFEFPSQQSIPLSLPCRCCTFNRSGVKGLILLSLSLEFSSLLFLPSFPCLIRTGSSRFILKYYEFLFQH